MQLLVHESCAGVRAMLGGLCSYCALWTSDVCLYVCVCVCEQITLMLYHGHEEGAREADAIHGMVVNLPPNQWVSALSQDVCPRAAQGHRPETPAAPIGTSGRVCCYAC